MGRGGEGGNGGHLGHADGRKYHGYGHGDFCYHKQCGKWLALSFGPAIATNWQL